MNDDLREAITHLRGSLFYLEAAVNDLETDYAADGPPRGLDMDDLCGLDFPMGRIRMKYRTFESALAGASRYRLTHMVFIDKRGGWYRLRLVKVEEGSIWR